MLKLIAAVVVLASVLALSHVNAALLFRGQKQSADADPARFQQLPFDLQRAIDGVYFSKITYCTGAHIKTWQCGACPQFRGVTNVTVANDQEQDAQAFVGFVPPQQGLSNRDGQIVMGFRGTTDLLGWLVDLNFPAVEYGLYNCSQRGFGVCKVHEGLMHSTQKLLATMLPAMQRLVDEHPKADIFVTGHSMGAAQAEISWIQVKLGIKCDNCRKFMYSYGAPRVVNPALSSFMWSLSESDPNSGHYRASNLDDIITHIAPIVFDEFGLGNWIHVPREVFFHDPQGYGRQFRICKDNATHEDPTCGDSSIWYDMLSMRNHTRYLDLDLGCFLEGDADKKKQEKKKTNR